MLVGQARNILTSEQVLWQVRRVDIVPTWRDPKQRHKEARQKISTNWNKTPITVRVNRRDYTSSLSFALAAAEAKLSITTIGAKTIGPHNQQRSRNFWNRLSVLGDQLGLCLWFSFPIRDVQSFENKVLYLISLISHIQEWVKDNLKGKRKTITGSRAGWEINPRTLTYVSEALTCILKPTQILF